MEYWERRLIGDCEQAPDIQRMYNIPMPVSTIRTRMRQEFEKNRFVNKIPVVDVLLLKNNAEYQVRPPATPDRTPSAGSHAGRPGTTGLRTLI